MERIKSFFETKEKGPEWVDLNFNSLVKVRVTPEGEKLYLEHYKLVPLAPGETRKINRDEDGWTKMQLGEAAQIFGPAMSLTNPRPPIGMEFKMEAEEKELEEGAGENK